LETRTSWAVIEGCFLIISFQVRKSGFFAQYLLRESSDTSAMIQAFSSVYHFLKASSNFAITCGVTVQGRPRKEVYHSLPFLVVILVDFLGIIVIYYLTFQ